MHNSKALLAVNLSAVAIIAAVTLWLCLLPKAQATPAGSPTISDQITAEHQATVGEETTYRQEPTPASEQEPGQASLQNPDTGWLGTIAARTKIPSRALQAYVQAAKQLKLERPECGLAWNTLAAIGLVESEHAYGQLRANGDVASRIIGPVLNGNGFAAILDSDGGAFDGDSRWDRAVGPLQFIPQTWQRYARDGNGDGTADPQNIDDAALSAAEYLCTAALETGPAGLKSATGWSHAVLAYNQSSAYLDSIYQAANRYAKQSAQ